MATDDGRHMSRVPRPVLIIGLVAVLGVVIGTVSSPAALAGPPPPATSGALLQITPTSGRAATDITANYWYVDPFGGKCAYTTVEFSWDGKVVATATVDPPDPADLVYCSATQVFKTAPTAAPGNHVLSTLACFIDGNGAKQCPGSTLARLTYVVLPTPTVTVVPASGLATAAFSATYSTGETTCTYPQAQFSWDGKPVGSLVRLDPTTCSAVLKFAAAPVQNGAGPHRVTAEACNGGCSSATQAGTTYIVTAPKAAATPTPLASASASAAASVSPSESPIESPSAEPSPSPSDEPTAQPTAEPSAPPRPGPTPTSSGGVFGGTTAASQPPSGAGPYVPEMAAYVGGPHPDEIYPAVILTNLFLTLLILFLFALTAEIFNSTMDENRDEIHGWWLRLARGPFGILGSLTVPGASLTRLAGTGRFGSIARVLAVLFLLGLVYSFLSPDFGLNTQSLTLFISLVVALGFLTYFEEGSTSRLAVRRYRANASIRLYGTAVLVSILAVVISRLVTFQPGLVYGFIASAVVVSPIAMNRRDDATLVLVPAVGLLVVSVAAWLLLGPVRVAAAGGAWAPGLAETILAMILIGGLETLFVTMIPLRFLDGATVMGWSKVAWVLTFGTVTFLWWQLLLNQDHAYVEAMEQSNVQVVLGTVIVFMLTTGGLWSYFRFRPKPVEAEV